MKGLIVMGSRQGCSPEIGYFDDYHGRRSNCNAALTGIDDSTRACRFLPCLAVYLATSCMQRERLASQVLGKLCLLEPVLAWSCSCRKSREGFV